MSPLTPVLQVLDLRPMERPLYRDQRHALGEGVVGGEPDRAGDHDRHGDAHMARDLDLVRDLAAEMHARKVPRLGPEASSSGPSPITTSSIGRRVSSADRIARRASTRSRTPFSR